jgi:DNA repair exonuclease SbcCD ATPase subunit
MSNIRYVYHISDIYVHCDKRHNEYEKIFSKFLEIEKENALVLITGNLLYSKSKITPKEIILTRNFLFSLAKKCPLVIIPGKSDCLKVKDDNITAIVSKCDNIFYFRESGNYKIHNITLSYTHFLDKPIEPDKSSQYTIGIYNGNVGKPTLYNGKKITKSIPVSDFQVDFLMLGGIGKTQKVKESAFYAGSFIQKDYTEDWSDHGYLLWDLQEKSCQHFPIDNEYRHVTLKILDGTLITPTNNLPKNLYIKWDITESGIETENKINSIQNKIRSEYNVEEELYVHNSFLIEKGEEKEYFFDLSLNKQIEYALSWSRELSLEEKEKIKDLVIYYNQEVIDKNTFIQWKLLDLEFENMICYTEKQKIHFNLEGINGIIAQNNAGKSALFDILIFSLFGKSTRTDTYSYKDLMNKNGELKCSVRFQDIKTNDIYTIRRETSKSIRVYIEKNGLKIYDGSTRDSNQYINSLIGTYEDFMTLSFMAQTNIHNYLLMKNKKEFMGRILQLDIYEKFHKSSKQDAKEKKSELKILKSNTKNISIENLESKIRDINSSLDGLKIEKDTLLKNINESKLEKDKLVLKPLLLDTDKRTKKELQDLQDIKDINIQEIQKNIKDLEDHYFNKWNEKIPSSIEIKEYKDNSSVLKNIFDGIVLTINLLKEARGKKTSDISYVSYEKTIKLLNKNIKAGQEFVENKIDINEDDIEKMNDRLVYLLQNKPERKELPNIKELEKTLLQKKELFNKIDDYEIGDLEKDKEKLKGLTRRYSKILKAEKNLHSHKYNPDCKFCCDNPFVKEAKKEIIDKNEVESRIKILEKNIPFREKALEKKILGEEIIGLEKEIKDYHHYKENNEKLSKVEKEIEELNTQLKKDKKKLKLSKSFLQAKNYISKLEIFKEEYEREHLIKVENDKIKDYKNQILCVKQYSNLQVKLDDLKKINYSQEIKIKEENEKIKGENKQVQKMLTLFSDLIENNNTKLLNLAKKEVSLIFELEKHTSSLQKYKSDLEEIKKIEDELKVINHFIKMTHYDGIPSYLLDNIQKTLEENVNTILAEYSSLEVKITDEIRTSQDIGVKMLCGSEKFLVELAFRVALQSMSNISKPNFFICDEGWSCLDEKTRSNLNSILKTLLDYNTYILTVSHLEDVRKWMNNYIRIDVNNGQRKIIQ